MGQTGSTEWWIRESSGNLHYVFDDGSDRVQITDTQINISAATNDSDWHHVAIVLDRTNDEIRSYLDSVLVHTNTSATIANLDTIGSGTSDIRLGAYNTSASNRFDGQQTRYRISDTALAPSEFIVELPTNLVAHWKLNEGTGQVVGDSSGNNRDGELGHDTATTTNINNPGRL